MDDESIEIAGVLHDAAHDTRVADRSRAIAERHRARQLQQADLGNLRAVEAGRQGRQGKQAHAAGIARAAQQKIDHRRLVNRRIGIGAGNDRRDAARRRRQGRGRDRLAMFGAWLADERPHVDEAGRHAIAAAIDDSRVGGEICRHYGGANIADQAIDDQDTAHGLAEQRRIDQPRIDERQRLVGNGSGGGTFHAKLALIHWANAAPRPPIRRSAPRPPSRPARG